MRVLKQSQSAEFIVCSLNSGLITARQPPESNSPSSEDALTIQEVVKEIHHASLEADGDPEKGWLQKKMPRGYGSVFALTLQEVDFARNLPSKLLLFHHATSLGGIESLIEWRTMTDSTATKDLLRISVGVESPEDLLADLIQGLRAVANETS